MAEIHEIKNRIVSVKSTAKVTKAMQMISASRMQQAQLRALAAAPYSKGIYELVAKLAGQTESKNAYLEERAVIENIAIMVIGTNRGFVGSLLSGLTAETYNLVLDLHEKYPGAAIHGISVHKTGLNILAHAHVPSNYHFAQDFENIVTTDLTAIFKLVRDKYLSGECDRVYVVYPHFVNTLLQKPQSTQILPVSLPAGQQVVENPFIYEPGLEEVLDSLLYEYVQSQIYTAILEGLASEHSARMLAMKNATDNAVELEQKLNLSYNRQRQAGITQQLIEVINGAG
jgi:F-type H+-transporting ATPase subunit gamma